MVLLIHDTILQTRKDCWRDNKIKQRELKNKIKEKLGKLYNVEVIDENRDFDTCIIRESPLVSINLEKMFEIIKNQLEY